jgi:hypothetical protein
VCDYLAQGGRCDNKNNILKNAEIVEFSRSIVLNDEAAEKNDETQPNLFVAGGMFVGSHE